jgi:hypothetical protein
MSKVKETCRNCNKLATWLYMPGDGTLNGNYCCNDCVPRGCSCMLDDNDQYIIDLDDDLKRPEPCCEWVYNKDGY